MKRIFSFLLVVLIIFCCFGCSSEPKIQIIEEEIPLTTENFSDFFDVIMEHGDINISENNTMLIPIYSGETTVTMMISPTRNYEIINIKNVRILVYPIALSSFWGNDYWQGVGDYLRCLAIDIPSSGNRTVSVKYRTTENFYRNSDWGLTNCNPDYILKSVEGSVVVRKQVTVNK